MTVPLYIRVQSEFENLYAVNFTR